MKWLLLFFLSNYLLADDEQYFLQTIKEDVIEKRLFSSSALKSCENAGDIEAKSSCLEDKIKNLDKGRADQLLKDLNLGKTELHGDPNQQRLAKYLSDVVKKALYGNEADNHTLMRKIPQETFTLVYERQVGKALFLELSQYCLHNQGITSLSGIVNSTIPGGPEGMVGNCLGSLKGSCELSTDHKNVTNSKGCLFQRRLIEFKSVLNKLKEDKKFWQEVRSQDGIGLELLDKQIAAKTPGEISTQLSNISSKDIVDDGYGEKDKYLSKTAQEMQEKCVTNPTDESCKPFFKKGSYESMGSLRLQRELELNLKIKKLDDANLGQLKETAAKSSLFSLEELKNMEQDSEESIRQKIKEKYDQEKIAVIEDINERRDEIGITKDQVLSEAEAKDKLNNINTLLKNKPDELRAVHFFSNVIVSTFSFKSDAENKKRVLGGIDQEIKALQAKTDDPYAKDAITYLQGIKQGRQAASENESHFIDPTEIDHLLFD